MKTARDIRNEIARELYEALDLRGGMAMGSISHALDRAITEAVEALQAELDEQCKLHSLGAEREYILLGKIARLERVAEAARKVNQILQDTWARDEIDSFDFQPLNEALDKLGKD